MALEATINSNKLMKYGDKIGATVSGACAVHCAIAPLALTLAPLMGINVIFGESFESFLILTSFALASLTIGFSLVKKHRKFLPLLIFLLGAALVSLAQLGLTTLPEPALMTLGGLSIMLSHFVNLRFCKSCKTCSH